MRIGQSTFIGFQRQLNETQRRIALRLESIASGKASRLDSASLSRVSGLSSKIRGLAQASLNINQGRGLLGTALDAIQSQLQIVSEMRVLALQGSNSSLSFAERKRINESLEILRKDFDRIARDTDFNGRKLLNGDSEEISLQVGFEARDQIQFSIGNLHANQIFESFEALGQFKYEGSSTNTGTGGDSLLSDFNGDGILDLVSARNSNSLTGISFGNGDGSFGFSRTISSLASPIQAKTADFNQDGNLDLVLASQSQWQILLGDGEGSFDLHSTGSFGLTMASLEIGDFDQDGDVDVIALGTSTGSGQIQRLLNNGEGELSSVGFISETFSVPHSSSGDLNSDGILDLVYVATALKSAARQVAIRLGNGDGSFGALTTFDLKPGAGPSNESAGIRLGDIDGDGDLDIVSSNLENQLVALFNNGSGAFSSAQTLSAAVTFNEFELLDFNGDGILDIVGAGNKSSNLISLSGLGAGVFASPVSVQGSAEGESLSIGDLNGDGVLDAVSMGDSAFDFFLGLGAYQPASNQIHVTSEESAGDLLQILDRARDLLETEASKLSGLFSRLDFVQASNLLARSAAEDDLERFYSVDLANEIAELVKDQILLNAQTAVFAQSQLNLKLVLELLPD